MWLNISQLENGALHSDRDGWSRRGAGRTAVSLEKRGMIHLLPGADRSLSDVGLTEDRLRQRGF